MIKEVINIRVRKYLLKLKSNDLIQPDNQMQFCVEAMTMNYLIGLSFCFL